MNKYSLILLVNLALNRWWLPTTSSTGQEEIPTVSYCDLITSPEKYDNKIIRIKASYFSGRHSGFFYELSCDGLDKRTHAELSCSSDEACEKIREVLNSALNNVGLAELTVVGRFNGPGEYAKPSSNSKGFRFKLEFNKIEKASPIPPGTPGPK